ncbi:MULTISPECIES: MurR/RpiR family transcriptional regulator [unclassified Rhizobium]|uniref:MurR/RpiR family transcriptional regulator n=1 Tax=unclassified Rhizobium TaxID=2613769 RepID=UPI0015FFF279|nr:MULTISPECIES: MurR/RpiR family transcriptional regulator [unclassified Rhizobium]MBB1250604.1 MurR/RpiR family transcriptional regulator [Rhizobium sp. G21]MCV3764663.1 MurR/RpiR family transcriptional regulator [Rhizobium sp. TRM95796]
MTTTASTVSDLITAGYDAMTRAEKQLANSLLDNYPVSGLGSITTVAEAARVSTPTVVRMVQKLGFKGFTEFQSRLHQELEETISNPITKHERMAPNAPGAHILNRFAEAVMANMRQSLGALDPQDFDAAARLIGDRKRSVYLAGGRITGAIAEYLFTHLQVIRPGVTRISSNASSWPHYVLNMSRGDVLILFDIRRYESQLEALARTAAEHGADIVLFTDQWGSPIVKHARHSFRLSIEAPSAWDSSVVTLFVVEALIEAIQGSHWEKTRERMTMLEELFESTPLFRKPISGK